MVKMHDRSISLNNFYQTFPKCYEVENIILKMKLSAHLTRNAIIMNDFHGFFAYSFNNFT